MQSSVFKRSAVALAIAGAFGLGAIAADRYGAAPEATAATVAAPVAAPVPAAVAAPSQRALPDFADLVAKQSPSVVEVAMSRGLSKTAGREGRAPRGGRP